MMGERMGADSTHTGRAALGRPLSQRDSGEAGSIRQGFIDWETGKPVRG